MSALNIAEISLSFTFNIGAECNNYQNSVFLPDLRIITTHHAIKKQDQFPDPAVCAFLINSGKSVGSICIDEQVLRYSV